MSRSRTIVAVGAALALAGLGSAGVASAQEGADVFNYGGCASEGFPVAQEGFGPLVLVIHGSDFKFIEPQGISAFGPAAKPSGLIGC